MKKLVLILLVVLARLPLWAQTDLTVEITGVTILKGEVYVSIYSNESSFMKTDQAFGKVKVPATQSALKVKLKDVPAGDYAVAVFQDLNANELLDVSEMKIPKEPFGFSNNAKGIKGPATFQQAKFHLQGETTIKVELVNNLATPNKDKSDNPK
jgi:uncharacterized protein (DUF2141 family)